MLVSVVIPAFNVSGCIGRAIDSVLAQTHQDLEVIVVDDASTDNTVAYVQQRATLDQRISVIAMPRNAGPSVARNRGIQAASGRWVAILDADDAYERDRVAALCAIGEAQRADLVADNLAMFDGDAAIITRLALPDVSSEVVRQITLQDYLANCMTGVSEFDYGQFKGVMRKAFLDGEGIGYRETLRHGEDFMLYADMLLAGANFVFVGRAYYIFTERVGSQSSKASAFSRTVVDFDAMRAHTLALLSQVRPEADPSIRRLIHERALAIQWHKSRVAVTSYARERNFTGLIAASLQDWRIAAVIARKLTSRLVGRSTWRHSAPLLLAILLLPALQMHQ